MATNKAAPLEIVPSGYEAEGIKTERGEREGIYCDECPSMQEHHIANILDSFGQWYEHRINVNIENKYFFTWDFFLGEDIGMVIQADGANGHGTRYSLSEDVMQCMMSECKNILHLEAETEDELRESIIKALGNTEDK